ncbi:unnamed protein product [Vicia faba]|uniref:Uncharacterized protein n=1 Tax=Vicia faba TaxID=3906 RepID=A0AAV1AQE7_VICFA|nr:unnamed protein product [Vicia faba]
MSGSYTVLGGMFDPKHSMTSVGINNGWIKSEENPPFTKDLSGPGSLSRCGGRLSNFRDVYLSLVVVLTSITLDSNTIFTLDHQIICQYQEICKNPPLSLVAVPQ